MPLWTDKIWQTRPGYHFAPIWEYYEIATWVDRSVFEQRVQCSMKGKADPSEPVLKSREDAFGSDNTPGGPSTC
ncbi:hypothetical protein Sjap_021882 [Stephania japonica]|uniref:Uncharacterized protein n=1 Tax=Stephania japonica TaxID=461633 RepID=A0AAP0EMV0_9MAGN